VLSVTQHYCCIILYHADHQTFNCAEHPIDISRFFDRIACYGNIEKSHYYDEEVQPCLSPLTMPIRN
jgi:hypothetical protein